MEVYGTFGFQLGIQNWVRIVAILTPLQLLEITLIGNLGTELEKLLLELTLRMVEGVIDLTGDRPNFTPPLNTKVTLPPGVEMPTNIHILGAFTTTYSM